MNTFQAVQDLTRRGYSCWLRMSRVIERMRASMSRSASPARLSRSTSAWKGHSPSSSSCGGVLRPRKAKNGTLDS